MLARFLGIALCVTIFTFSSVISVRAADPVTEEQVKALTLKAADLVAKSGLEKAHEAFSKEGDFKFGEVYVNVIDFDGVWKVYPPKPAGEGQIVLGVQDADGKFLVRDIIKLAQEKGEGWVQYRWQNPATNKIQAKASYVKRVPGQNLITYIGIYK